MRHIVVLVIVLFLFGATIITGQESEIILSENSIKSLSNGIHSENIGLKKSAISMVGRYKLKQVCPILIQQFTDESELGYKLMIAEMIYDVGCPEAIERFRTALNEEKIEELKYFCEMLHENYVFANNLSNKH